MAKRAVLIGINHYKIPGADLRGCVNDVKNMSSVLTRFYGFPQGNLTILTNLKASKKAMEAAIHRLISRARNGDVLLLHYSGHGSNVPDDNGDEADNRDEILCPTDLDWRDPLRDDWLRSEFDRLPAGVNLTVIMDCCHSGTNTRALPMPNAPVIERFLPCPLDLMASESGRALRKCPRTSLHRRVAKSGKISDAVHARIPEILITGCRDTQTSADAYIGNTYNGALTYNLCAVLKEAKGKISYRDLHARTIQKLKRGRYDQVPQLEGQQKKFEHPFLSPDV